VIQKQVWTNYFLRHIQRTIPAKRRSELEKSFRAFIISISGLLAKKEQNGLTDEKTYLRSIYWNRVGLQKLCFEINLLLENPAASGSSVGKSTNNQNSTIQQGQAEKALVVPLSARWRNSRYWFPSIDPNEQKEIQQLQELIYGSSQEREEIALKSKNATQIFVSINSIY
jgi:hypothetical protein